MPIAARGWRWFKAKWRSGSTGIRVGLGALFAGVGFVYVCYGPLVFDAAHWALGKMVRVRDDRRIRVGVSVALAIVYLAALGASASTVRKTPASGDSPSPIAAVVATATTAPSAGLTGSAPAPTPDATQIVTPAPPAASPAPPVGDSDDESSAIAGSSFVPSATGMIAVGAAGSAQDRLPGEPDPSLTPGALNPAVTQATIGSTICVSGWTATIRPSSSFTTALKIKQIVQYGYSDTQTSAYEEDHLISLELGGAPADARNLWPEPYTVTLADGRSTGARTKDGFETKLKNQVCAGTITLAQAQSSIGIHWVHAYYGIALVASSTAAPLTTPPPAPIAKPTVKAVTAKPATPKPVAPAPPADPNAAAKAAGATAICANGKLSFSKTRSGTCSQDGGVHWWTGNVGAAGPGAH